MWVGRHALLSLLQIVVICHGSVSVLSMRAARSLSGCIHARKEDEADRSSREQASPRSRASGMKMCSKGGGCKYGQRAYWDSMYQGIGAAAEDGLPADEYSWYCRWEELEAFWRELVPSMPVPSVLIPGVGNDRTVADMWDAGYVQITAFDYSPDAVSRMRPIIGDRPIDCLCADATALPFDDMRFDAVLDKGTLDAIGISSESDLSAAVHELARVLTPGGVVVCISRALDREAILRAFADPDRWENLRDGSLHVAETGEVSHDLAADLYAWRRTRSSEM